MVDSNAQAPFLDVKSFAREVEELQEAEFRATAPARVAFVSIYETAEGESVQDDALREAYSSLVSELYDEEFDEALFELLTEARTIHREHLGAGNSLRDADNIVAQHFAQLERETHSLIDRMGNELGSREDGLADNEVDAFVDRYSSSASLRPSFEGFLSTLAKKIGKGVRAAAGKAWQGIKQVALGPLLNRIKPILNPLLNKVLQAAIGRLDVAVQPAARQLAQRLGFSVPSPAPVPALVPATPPDASALPPPAASADPAAAAPGPEDAGSPVQAAAGPGVSDIQSELDQLIAEALLTDDEPELELEMARLRAESSVPGEPVFSELEQARERLIRDLQGLKEGESPAPYVENFLPAVLPALRIARNMIGRPRIVSFLAGLLGKLISKLVGPQQTPALSRAIVDAGLKLVNLELSDEDRSRVALSAVAETLEETVSRVASLPDHVFEDQELLEGFALEAFEQAAAANLPAVFSESTYRRRPDLLEGGVNAAWLLFPLRRPTHKRCSRTFKVVLTPHMAEAIESFEGTPLSDYLQDQLGLPEGEDVEAEVHLFETLPGSTVADVAQAEGETPGLGAADEATVAQMHALTEEAAGVLLGKPGLGRNLPAWSDRRNVAAGQRLYHLAIPGRRPLTVVADGRKRVRRLAHVNVILDCPRDQVRVCVYLSEVKAQRLAVKIRQQAHIGSLAVGFHRFLGRRLPTTLKRRRRLRVVHPRVASPSALSRLPTVLPPLFATRLQEWLVPAFAEFVKTQSNRFLAASEDPADGLTLVFTVEHPPGLKEVCEALVAPVPPSAGIGQSMAAGSRPIVRVDVVAGHRCG